MHIKYRYDLPLMMRYYKLPMIGVEVGVGAGQFSRDLLSQGLEKLYSVDAWEQINPRGDGSFPQAWHDKNYEDAKKLLEPFGNKSIILRGKSVHMASHIPDNSCGLVYIDGDHSEEAVHEDIQKYWTKLVSGGIMAFHDYEIENPIYGVKKAVKNFALSNFHSVFTIDEDKVEDAGAYIIKP